MAKRAVLILLAISSPLSAQSSTTNCKWVFGQWTCETREKPSAKVLDNPAQIMKDAQGLVPDYGDSEEQRARTELMREQAEALKRERLRADQTADQPLDTRRLYSYAPRCRADMEAIEKRGETLKSRIASGQFMGNDLPAAERRDLKVFCLGYQMSNFDAIAQDGVRNPRPER